MKEPFWKRLFDFILALFVGIILFSPLWFFFSILIWIKEGSPIFYTQKRVGKNGKIFKAIKFRSMIPDAEKDVGPIQAKENDPRVTIIGRILRSRAMDELPQVLNILKGDMSFVGPRALRPSELEVKGNPNTIRIEDIPGYEQRIKVKPGLTGLAQIYLPSDAPRRKKFRLDVLYLKKQSFLLDLKLLFISLYITLCGRWESGDRKIKRVKIGRWRIT